MVTVTYKNMKRIKFFLLAVLLLAATGQSTQAATTEELQNQLAQLMAQLSALQAQVSTPSQGYVFERNLKIGMRGTDVQKLQEFLVEQKYLKLTNTTTYFGTQTKAALIAWQKAKNISPAIGFFGPLTRAKMNALLAAVVPATPSSAIMTGSSVAIKFASTGVRRVNVYLCDLQNNCNTVIAANIAVVSGDNTVTWAVPANIVAGAYKIKVEDVANSSWVVYAEVPLVKPVATATSTPPATQPTIVAISLQTPVATKAGASLAIKFANNNAKNVSISLCSDSTYCDVVVASRYAVTDGANSVSWTIPSATLAREYFVRIKDADDVNSAEFNSGRFAITAATTVVPPTSATFSVQTPVATKAGEVLSVVFTSSKARNASVSLCVDAQNCSIVLAPRVSVAFGTNNFKWTIPSTTPAKQYFIKIKDADNVNDPIGASGLFSITLSGAPTSTTPIATTSSIIEVDTPLAAYVGSPLNINFTSANIRNVSIVLCSNSATCAITAASNFAVVVDGFNTYAWAVPTTTSVGQYFIKMKDVNSASGEEFLSDVFTIGAAIPVPSITITQPANVVVEGTLIVKFTTSNIGSVDVYLCPSKTQCGNAIENGLPTTDGVNTFKWVVPTSTTPGAYYIKVAKAGSVTAYTLTANTFSIVAAPVARVCRDVSGLSELYTVCDESEEAVSGRCVLSKAPYRSFPGIPTIYENGMGIICGQSVVWVELRCCK
ncbi:MAG: SpoIID/LytB protein [uncultured bacterium]|nr:MAG: SpoIID/LytB protein [uncultured bacterium]